MGCSSSQLMCPIHPQYLEVLRSHQNRPAKCLTVLWALGQAGFTDLHEGLKGKSSGSGIRSPPGTASAPPLLLVVLLGGGKRLGKVCKI